MNEHEYLQVWRELERQTIMIREHFLHPRAVLLGEKTAGALASLVCRGEELLRVNAAGCELDVIKSNDPNCLIVLGGLEEPK